MQTHYCGCDIQLQSVITVSDEGEFPRDPDEHALAWEALYVPSASDEWDPNKAPTELAPSSRAEEQKDLQSIPETPQGSVIKETFLQRNQLKELLFALMLRRG